MSDGAVLPAEPARGPWPLPGWPDAVGLRPADFAGWEVTAPAAPDIWTYFRPPGVAPPRQGWKLHVSAGICDAAAVLGCALPVLLTEQAAFKVVASREHLHMLNRAGYGLAQVGKFLTVYPRDDAQAVRLAGALDVATRGLRGPAIGTDRPLTSGSLVAYRYGSHAPQFAYSPAGAVVPAIEAPDGTWVPDDRGPRYHAPAWAADPFVAAGIAAPPPRGPRLIGGRYLLVAPLYESVRGTVYQGVDLAAPGACIVKQAGRAALQDGAGGDAREGLRHEAAVLAALAPDPRFPAAHPLLGNDGDLFLPLAELPGESLDEYMRRLAATGACVRTDGIVRWGRELVAILSTVHARGWVYRDLKSTNIIVAPDGTLRLVDFDLACTPGAVDRLPGAGTRGYLSPQQAAGAPAAVADDIYGLGALLYLLATGAEPALAPQAERLPARPPALLNPAIAPGLPAVIARCLAPEPAARYPTLAALDVALAALDESDPGEPPSVASVPEAASPAASGDHYRDLAARLGHHLAQVVCGAAEQGDAPWVRGAGATGYTRDLSDGAAGVLLALAELAADGGDAGVREAVAALARWLMRGPRPAGAPLPGLDAGEAGVGAALLRAGQVLRDAALIAAAVEHARWVAGRPYGAPGRAHGTAGRLHFHLLLRHATGAPEHLAAAIAAGDELCRRAEDAREGGCCWPVPPAFGGAALTGYGAGAAGIGAALLDLFAATGDARYRETAGRAARRLAALPLPALDDGSGLVWPRSPGGLPGGPGLDDGAAGVGRFLLHAGAAGVLPEAAALAARAAQPAAHAGRAAGPRRADGLAGDIDFLLDMFQATGDPAYRAHAATLGAILEVFAVDQLERFTAPPAAIAPWAAPDLLTVADLIPCLLRLSSVLSAEC
jgi:hypothetical protein